MKLWLGMNEWTVEKGELEFHIIDAAVSKGRTFTHQMKRLKAVGTRLTVKIGECECVWQSNEATDSDSLHAYHVTYRL